MFETLFSETEIRERIRILASELTLFYKGKDLTAVVLMNGGMFFAADLLRRIDLPLHIDSLAVSSYANDRSTGELVIRSELKKIPSGRHVLLLDDILDTGLTLRKTVEYLKKQEALSVKTCVLLDKILPDGEAKHASADWYGFRVPNHYVVGYGLDSDEFYRNLPYIGRIAGTE